MQDEKNIKGIGMQSRNRAITVLIGILQAIGWTVVAQLIASLLPFLLFTLINVAMASTSWFWTSSGYERVAGELLFIAGFQCTVSLSLLCMTRRARLLNRSMVWVLAFWAIWHLLNAPLPILEMKPIGCDSFFFHNKRVLEGWLFSAGLLLNGMSGLFGVALYLFWDRFRN